MSNFPGWTRIGAAAAVLATTPLLGGCNDATANGDEFVVLTTFTVIADMAANVAGDRARVESITRAGAEIHGYEPTASDVVRASEADLILDNGLGLEAWFEDFLAQVDVPRVTLTEDIEPLAIAGGEYEGRSNPHAWMSPDNAEIYVRAIEAALADMDPDGAATYAANADAYVAEIAAEGDRLAQALAEIAPERRVLITCEGAFAYLAADAGLDEAYLWPVNAETQATPQSVADAVEIARDRDVPAVFCESTVNTSAMERVAQESGATFGGVLYVDSLTAADGPASTYLDLLATNVDTLTAGLGS
ncbi:metal ABC transporter solute-binding protein, Zn/Mn family [Demequina pelophila]|uniref:metal ABC transporter solute-binding protein, Zn/Mn family n=1 Tax=Demequina pelophila TaxID=1638984 RepID=UPI0007808758|nr:zinc ABC transporter substrate-binding protein [Demequina pelophila]